MTKDVGLIKDVGTSRLFPSLSNFGIDGPKAMKEILTLNSFFKYIIMMNIKMIKSSGKMQKI